MAFLKKLINKILGKILATVAVLYVLIPPSPFFLRSPYRDSGVFLYFGWRIINGELPYRDIWDHKPPVIFYINALGLALTNNSRWGVWAIEFISLILAITLGFKLIKMNFGIIPALLGSQLWVLTLVFLLQGGNFTTEYTLPMQFAALWLIYDYEQKAQSFRQLFLIGIIGALAFFTKQTSIGIWLAYVIYLVYTKLSFTKNRRILHEIFWILAGGASIIAVILIYFGFQNALSQFWSAAFQYNLIYSSTVNTLMGRLTPITSGTAPLFKLGLMQLAIIGYIIAFILLIFNRKIINAFFPLILVGLLDLPIELLLVSTSGRTYPHYYMTLLPVLALFTSLTVFVVFFQLEKWNISYKNRFTLTALVMLIMFIGGNNLFSAQFELYKRFNQTTVSDFITTATKPDDYVLLWGAESSVNFSALRKSPSRFVYQHPLYNSAYTSTKLVEEFLGDIINKHPRLLIDTRHPLTPIYNFPVNSNTIKTDINYIRTHYRYLQDIGPWSIYEYIDVPQ